MSSSILDTIITERQQDVAGQFQPSLVVREILQKVNEKERVVIARRFALDGQAEQETLELIGKSLSLTRERVRQIERSAVVKLTSLTPVPPALARAERAIDDLLHRYGGAMEREQFLDVMLGQHAKAAAERAALQLLMDEVLAEDFHAIVENETFRAGWKIPSVTNAFLEELFRAAEAIAEASTKPMLEEKFFEEVRKSTWYTAHTLQLDDDALRALLRLSQAVRCNTFGCWGKASWRTIAPRRMNDKIFLVLEAAGKPLHFTEIAQRINDAKFDHKVAYPATVHNELIADERFVLVGRGLYALNTWGYRPGVVADVIAHILTEAERPLTRDEVVREVLKQRVVSESTIYLSLLQKERFQKMPDGKYVLKINETSPSTPAPEVHSLP
ncbi:hypothetical protein HY629_01775 [Candidatus Uhrbacteria bacterium]|nr:hypothetical protein [Candidatus Uhrbacteria bacterium]